MTRKDIHRLLDETPADCQEVINAARKHAGEHAYSFAFGALTCYYDKLRSALLRVADNGLEADESDPFLPKAEEIA